jgi:hypothetical protein
MTAPLQDLWGGASDAEVVSLRRFDAVVCKLLGPPVESRERMLERLRVLLEQRPCTPEVEPTLDAGWPLGADRGDR